MLLLTLVWAPLPSASVPIWAQSLLSVLVFLTLALIGISLLGNSVQISRVLRKAWPIAALLALTAAWISWQAYKGYPYTLSRFDTLAEAIWSWALVAYFVACLQLLNTRKRIQTTAFVLVGCALFQAVFGAVMTLSGTEYLLFVPKDSYLGVSTGTFVNRNSQAAYLVMAVSIGIGMMAATLRPEPPVNWRERTRRILHALLSRKIVLRLSLLIIVIGLVLTHSRMGNSAFFTSLLVIGTLGLVLTRTATKGLIVLLVSFFILDLTIVGAFFGVDKVVERLQGTSIATESRVDVNRVVSAHLLSDTDTLIYGSGAGTFYLAFPELRVEGIGKSFYADAHNDYFQFAMEFGLIGFIPLILVIVLTFTATLYAQRKHRSRLLRYLALGVAMSIFALALHELVDFNLQIPANALTFVLILALGWVTALSRIHRPTELDS